MTLTVTEGWTSTSAVGYINFPTSVHASIPGTEELPVEATLGDTEREFTTFAYTYGEPKPTVSKTKNVNDVNWVRPGEIFSFSLLANRDKAQGTQAVDGVLVDKLPPGLKFLQFNERPNISNYRLSRTGETLRVEPSYDPDTREIRVVIPEDFAAHYVRVRNIGIDVLVQVEDAETLNELGITHNTVINNTVDFEWTSIDDQQSGTVTANQGVRLYNPVNPGSGTVQNNKRLGSNREPVSEAISDRGFIHDFSNPTAGADLEVADIPQRWARNDRVTFSPRVIQLRGFPVNYEQDSDGRWVPAPKQGLTTVFTYDDETTRVVPAEYTAGNDWYVFTNPRADEHPRVRVTKTQMKIPNALAGRYSATIITDAVTSSGMPANYRPQNCAEYRINGVLQNRTGASTPNSPVTRSCVDLPITTTSPDPWVNIGDGPAGQNFEGNRENLLASLKPDGERGPGVPQARISFGLHNSGPNAGAADPVAYLTTPPGLMLNPDSVQRRNPGNNACVLNTEDLIITNAGASPNGGHRYRIELNEETKPDGLPVVSRVSNPTAARLNECGFSIQVLRDMDSDVQLMGGNYTSANLTERLSAFAITVMERNHDEYLQTKEQNLRDTYGVVPRSEYPAGVTQAPKVHQATYGVTIPAVNARVVRKEVKGDRDDHWKTQVDWSTWTHPFGDENNSGFWNDSVNRNNHLGIGAETVQYRLSAGTEGTIPLSQAYLYDFLPSNDDLSRGSKTGSSYENQLELDNNQFPRNGLIPTLAGPVVPETLPEDQVRIEYSRSSNPCRPNLPDVDSTGCDPNWLNKEAIGDDWASVKAIRIAFDHGVDRVHDFTYTMNMPDTSTRDGEPLRRSDVAYNYVAFNSFQGNARMEPLGPFMTAARFNPTVSVNKEIDLDEERPKSLVRTSCQATPPARRLASLSTPATSRPATSQKTSRSSTACRSSWNSCAPS